jgi:hypothetical protein
MGFMSCLIKVFQSYPLVIISYTLDIRDLIAEFPEAKGDPYGLAHVFLLTHIMKYIAEKILSDPRYIKDRKRLSMTEVPTMRFFWNPSTTWRMTKH